MTDFCRQKNQREILSRRSSTEIADKSHRKRGDVIVDANVVEVVVVSVIVIIGVFFVFVIFDVVFYDFLLFSINLKT
jgi:hypothetical protein